MGVNHRRLHVLLPQQFLHRSDVVTTFTQMGGERMSERMAGRPLYHTGPPHRHTHRLLHKRLIDVMPPLFALGRSETPRYPERTSPLSFARLMSSGSILCPRQLPGLQPLIEFLRVESPLPSNLVRKGFSSPRRLINARPTHLQVLPCFDDGQPLGFHRSVFPIHPLALRGRHYKHGVLSSPRFRFFPRPCKTRSPLRHFPTEVYLAKAPPDEVQNPKPPPTLPDGLR